MQRVFAVWLCLALGVACRADIITVDDDGPADHTTIQAAIDASNNGDIVVVCPGTYTGVGNYDINFAGKAITVRSTAPQDPAVVAATIINCEYQGRGFYFGTSEGTNSVLDGLTITNAGYYDLYDAYDGGGIYCDGSSPTIANCRILSSIGYFGGGICNDYDSSPTLVNCVLNNNLGAYGGGMCNFESDPNVINCTFSGNTSVEQGGGMYSHQSNPIVNNCTFSGNLSYYEGGGMLVNGLSNTMVNNCILWGDVPDEIYVGTGTVTVNHSDVQGGWVGEGNIDDDPLFVNPNGPDGIVGTDDDNLRLSHGSPCIDAGDSTSVSNDAGDVDGDGVTTAQTPWDIDGNLRFLDDPSTTDTGTTEGPIPIVDMGAYESSGLAMIGDFEPDGDVDLDDLVVIVARWLESGCGTCGGADLSGDGSVNLADFATFAKTGLVGGGESHKPILAPIGNKSILEEQNLNFTVSATDPDGDNLTYSAFNLPDSAGFEPLTQVFDWTPTVGQTGQYFVTILAFDGTEVDSETVAITVSPRPVGHWTMDDDANNMTVLDSSSNENHGTAQQNTEDMSTIGIIDGALDFDGTSDYVDLGTSTVIKPSSQLSLACWLYVDELSVAGVINNKIDGQNSGYRLLTADTGVVYYQVGCTGGLITVGSSSVITTGAWHLIAATYDENNGASIYIDGVAAGSAAAEGQILYGTGSSYLGCLLDGNGDPKTLYEGSLDDIKIYDRVLTSAEILQLATDF